jgi:putative MATE family efflux protein
LANSNTYLRKNLSLAWPLAINALLVQSMFMIDTLLVAPLGELPVAAMGIAITIIACALGVGMAIGNGVQILVARAYGSNVQQELAVTYWVGMFVNVSIALVFFFILVFFETELVSFLTDIPELISLSVSYLAITKYVILMAAYTQICTSFYNGSGVTKIPLKGYLIEIPVNALLSYLFINGFAEFQGLGLEGAALGSLAAVSFRVVFFLVVMKLDKKVDVVRPKWSLFLGAIQPQLREILPIAANFFVLFIGASVYQLLFAQLELHSFVAITLIFPWFRIGTQFVAAWAHASAIHISQTMGQKNISNLPIFIASCKSATIVLTVIVALLFFILSQNILSIYPKIEPETQKALAIIAPLYIILPIVRGYNSVSGNILRALGDSQRALRVNFTAQWLIALPLCALLILYFQVSVFWAFAIMPIEELLKVFHFQKFIKLNLKRIQRSIPTF